MHPEVGLLRTLAARILGSDSECPVPTLEHAAHTCFSPRGILHSPTTPLDPLVALDLLDLGLTIDVALRVSHPGAFLAVALHPIPLATSSRFGEIPGGKGWGTDWSKFLYMTGVSIPRGLAHMGKRGIGQLLLHAPWSKTASKAGSFRSWLIGNDSENMRGASECLVPECFVQVSAPPPSSSARASRPGHPSVIDARTSRGAGGSWEPPHPAARVQSPIWAVCLDMVTRSSHTQLMQSQHAVQIRCWCLIGPAHSCTGCMENDRCFAPTPTPTRTRSQQPIKHGSHVPRIQISVDQVPRPHTPPGHGQQHGRRLSLPRQTLTCVCPTHSHTSL